MTLQREPRERDPAFLGWVAKLPCLACMVRGTINWRVQVAHLRAASPEYGKRYTGKGEKPSDRWVLPLCMPHHTGDSRRVQLIQHDMGELEFWAALGIDDPFMVCMELYQAFQQIGDRTAGIAIISKAAARGRLAIEGAADAHQ